MALNKKGIYFTLMSLVFVVLFAFVLTLPKHDVLGKKNTNIELRVDTMNTFLEDLEKDLSRSLYISSFRSLLGFEQYIVNSGEFLTSTDAFLEMIRNGTLDGQGLNIMQDSTFDAWLEKISLESAKLNIISNFTIYDISIYQDSPWDVKSRADLEIHIKDINSIAEWRINKSIITSISIIGFEDPLYIVSSYGRLTNIITETPYANFVTGQNVSNFISHVNNSYYKANSNSPSFLQRLVNDLSPSEYGIESMVNLETVADRNLPIFSDSTIIDYLYWQNLSTGIYRLNNTPSWVRLDENHLEVYGLQDISYLE